MIIALAGSLWIVSPCRAAAEKAPNAATNVTTILKLGRQWHDPAPDCGGTVWRYYEMWQADVVRKDDGSLVRVDPFVWRKTAPGGNERKGPFELATTTKIIGSPFPQNGWERPVFDDSGWLFMFAPMDFHYRSLALICVRGTFEVTDPAKAPDLDISLTFQGGAVAYLNGKEIGREGLPTGKIDSDTLATDYSPEQTRIPTNAYSGLMPQNGQWECIRLVFPEDAAHAFATHLANLTQEQKDQVVANYAKRFRTLSAKVPANQLVKGVNVLAVAIHRAPADEAMFTRAPKGGAGWNRCLLTDLAVTTAAKTDAVVPNIARSEGMQVWNASTVTPMYPTYYGDPNTPLRPIHLTGLRNGTFSGQFVVSSSNTIKGFKAAVTELRSKTGAVIPAAAITLGYAKWVQQSASAWNGLCVQFDPLDTAAPGDIVAALRGYKGWGWGTPAFNSAYQPIWVSVAVPRDAKAGDYDGTVTVSADGEKTVQVPVQLRVVGEWTLPDPVNFKPMVGMVESPDSVARQYNVKMWSEEHWKLLDQVFALMAQLNVSDLYIPLLARTNLGNDESMVRWIRQPDGSYQHDFSIVERYVDTATKHLGKRLKVVCWIQDLPFYRTGNTQMWAGNPVQWGPNVVWPLPCTVFDPATGKTNEIQAPQWGTPEAQPFWKPVLEGVQAILAKRSMETGMLLGCRVDMLVNQKCEADCKAVLPHVKWYQRTHHVGGGKELGYLNWGNWLEGGQDVMVVNWLPDDTDTGYYNWRAPEWETSYPIVHGAWGMRQTRSLPTFRLAMESFMLFKREKGGAVMHGIGCQGADYWAVIPDAKDDHKNSVNRFTSQAGNLDQASATHAFLGAGKNGPVATCHFRLLQESLQDMEARIYVQDALLDHKDKLGPDLAKRSKDVCDERTRQLRYYSENTLNLVEYERQLEYGIFNADWYRSNTEQLYALAGEVAKALAK